MSSNHTKGRLLIGFILVLIGVYLLLHNFGLVPFTLPSALFSWPSLLILIGLVMVGTKESKSGGFTLMLIGIVFLLPKLFYVTMDEILQFWPLIFVFIGIGILVRHNREKKKDHKIAYTGAAGEATDYVDETAIFSSTRKVIISDYFKGGNITAVAGSVTIDLAGARLAEGNYTFSLFVLLGSVDIIVPNDWNASNQSEAILGKAIDSRRHHMAFNPGISKQLRVTGSTILGNSKLTSPQKTI